MLFTNLIYKLILYTDLKGILPFVPELRDLSIKRNCLPKNLPACIAIDLSENEEFLGFYFYFRKILKSIDIVFIKVYDLVNEKPNLLRIIDTLKSKKVSLCFLNFAANNLIQKY